MEVRKPVFYQDVEKCVDDVIRKVGKKIVFTDLTPAKSWQKIHDRIMQARAGIAGREINLDVLLGRVTKQVAFKRWRRNPRHEHIQRRDCRGGSWCVCRDNRRSG